MVCRRTYLVKGRKYHCTRPVTMATKQGLCAQCYGEYLNFTRDFRVKSIEFMTGYWRRARMGKTHQAPRQPVEVSNVA